MTSTQTLRLKAFAKINLSLDIIGVQQNGYHIIETIMQSVSLHDLIIITTNTSSNGIALTCSHPSLCSTENNTAYQAAKAFFTYCQTEMQAISIHIKKHIPSGAGLAGGSADAAAVLHGLNHLFGANLTLTQLCKIGATIGADVPFCICGGTMLATGIGDKLSTIPPLPCCSIVICKPPISISTQEAYQKIDNTIIKKHPDTQRIYSALKQNNLTAVAQNVKNIFEEAIPIASVQSIIAQMKQMGALGACMSGSGSAVFGIFSTEALATQCAAHLKTQFEDVFICQPVNQGIE